MLLRKWISFGLLGMAFFLAFPAFATSYNFYERSFREPFVGGSYIEANAGWVGRDWTSLAANNIFSNTVASDTSNATGGWSGGVDVGYQFNKAVDIEGGWYYLPKPQGYVSQDAPKPPTADGYVQVYNKSWFCYGAGKVLLPVMRSAYVFGKLGIAYTHNTMSNAAMDGSGGTTVSYNGTISTKYVSAIMGAGLQVYVNSNAYVLGQYMMVPGHYHSPTSGYVTPRISLYMLGMGYQFEA